MSFQIVDLILGFGSFVHCNGFIGLDDKLVFFCGNPPNMAPNMEPGGGGGPPAPGGGGGIFDCPSIGGGGGGPCASVDGGLISVSVFRGSEDAFSCTWLLNGVAITSSLCSVILSNAESLVSTFRVSSFRLKLDLDVSESSESI
eukprot:NODE_222_length_13951_cov_0.396982.p9 type:complete len:144 gc:universal NODE_222_length_13951_cov_0.396982:3018-2587(-)